MKKALPAIAFLLLLVFVFVANIGLESREPIESIYIEYTIGATSTVIIEDAAPSSTHAICTLLERCKGLAEVCAAAP